MNKNKIYQAVLHAHLDSFNDYTVFFEEKLREEQEKISEIQLFQKMQQLPIAETYPTIQRFRTVAFFTTVQPIGSG